VTDSWWSDVDDATLNVLAAAGGRLTLAELASRLGMSEDAARSIVSMLAEQGRVRIAAVELVCPRALARAPTRALPGRRRPQSTPVTGKARRATP
jgi:DNA-binding Lrp family transcriptional regulator